MIGATGTGIDLFDGFFFGPEDTSASWPAERVQVWLAKNGFSRDWQETFKTLELHDSRFLDIGRDSGTKGNVAMMQHRVFPQLHRQCMASGTEWDLNRERREGRKLCRLICAIWLQVEATQAMNEQAEAKDQSPVAAPRQSSRADRTSHDDIQDFPEEQKQQVSLPSKEYSPPLSREKESTPPVMFYAESMRDFNIEHSPEDSEYPFLLYARGERFAIVRTKRNIWLACSQERETETLGWVYSENFRRTHLSSTSVLGMLPGPSFGEKYS
jgi:hypothetical protein